MYASTQKYSSKKPRDRKQYLDKDGVPPLRTGLVGAEECGGLGEFLITPCSLALNPFSSLLCGPAAGAARQLLALVSGWVQPVERPGRGLEAGRGEREVRGSSPHGGSSPP